MRVACDSSTSLAWCLPGQYSRSSEEMFLRALDLGLVVPDIWHVEMANILGLKHRSGNLSSSGLEEALALLGKLEIETAFDVRLSSIAANLDRMNRFQLAAYDAIYVELALMYSCPLMTFHRAMIRAARAAGVDVLTAE